jgi:lysophospholipase L1-like esterase
MTARNGFSSRKGRLIGCCIAAALVVTALFASSASAAKTPLTPTNYTALGDSLAFGYTAEKFNNNFPSEPPSAFEEGYTNFLVKKLAKAEKQAGNALNLINLGCPGEVSDGMIGENPMLGGGGEGNGKSDSSPCDYHKKGFPLHFNYGAPPSQLETAIGIVTTPGTFGATKYVTENIGSNDELAVVAACSNPEYLEAHGFPGGAFECLIHEAGEEGYYYKGGLFKHIITNLGTAVGVLRSFGYTGPVAVLGFYNPQAFILPGSDALQKKLNEAAECAIEAKTSTCTVEPKAGEKVTVPGQEKFGPNVVYANPFPKFNPQKSKAEKKAVEKYTEECNPSVQKFQTGADPGCEGDIHPTVKGYKALAKILYEAFGRL